MSPCPSCGQPLKDAGKHCTRCGISITPRSLELAQVILNLGWIARRSLGGFLAGGVGWILATAISRTVYFTATGTPEFSAILDFFPGKVPGATAIAGAFVGTVGGMIEGSAYKCFLGGFLGAVGGFLGGVSYPAFESLFAGSKYAYSFSMAGSWAIASGLIGLTSGLLEGTKRKISMGILGGAAGGALGGGVGSQIYGAIFMSVSSLQSMSWSVGRLIELVSGGIVGIHVWFFIGIAEKFYIFRRRKIAAGIKKICDHCSAENELSAWYCASCGNALQVAASSGQIRVTPYRGLERVSDAFQYLSWLSATVGVVTTGVLFVSFIKENFLFAVFGSLLLALLLYMVSILFRAIAEAIRIGMKLTETNKS